MLIAHYIGNHSADDLATRIGWATTRMVQRGPWRRCTHVEAIHAEHSDGSVTIASASLRDGGVRAKQARLSSGAWLISDVPLWSVDASIGLLETTRGAAYDLTGALATVLPLRHSRGRWFCNEWVGAPFVDAAHIFGPAQFAAICMSAGRDMTQDFFGSRA